MDHREWSRNYGWYGTLICEVVEMIRDDQIDAAQGGRILAAIELAKRTSGY